MPKLHRPHIPIAVRVQVAERQIGRETLDLFMLPTLRLSASDSQYLRVLLITLFHDRPFALDHDPALVNRKRYVRNGKTFYQPPANDPAHLIYRESGPGSDHDIKTRVRGDGALRSDLGQARYNKRVAKNRARQKSSGLPKTPGRLKVGDTVTWKVRGRLRTSRIVFISTSDSRPNKSNPKRKWPSRPFAKRRA